MERVQGDSKQSAVNASDSRRSIFLQTLTVTGGGLAFCLGILGLLSWALRLPQLASFSPGLVPMAPDSALLFVIDGAVLLLLLLFPRGRKANWPCLAAG